MPKTNLARKTRGITVLELIASIGVILAIAFVAPSVYQTLVTKTHDIKRLSNVEQLRTALQLYYLYNGSYPVAADATPVNGSDTLSQALSKSFLVLNTRLPVDPDSPMHDYIYQTSADGKNYVVTYCLLGPTDSAHHTGCDNKAYPKPFSWDDSSNTLGTP